MRWFSCLIVCTVAGVSAFLPTRADAQASLDRVATINIQGGRNPDNHADANARKWYNRDIAPSDPSLTNTLQTRTLSRGYSLKGLAAQEVCRTQWFNLTQRLVNEGALGSSPLLFKEQVRPSLVGGLSQECGPWFGNASLIRGTVVGSGSGVYPDGVRVWHCLRTYFTLCNTHITTDAALKHGQVNSYRTIAQYLSALAPSESRAERSFGHRPARSLPGKAWVEFRSETPRRSSPDSSRR
jgi:hypothetical protein